MKNTLIYTLTAILLTLSVSCEKVLDKTDLSGITPEVTWNSESTATLYLNKLYALALPTWGEDASITISDESNTGNTSLMTGQLGIDDISNYSTSYTYIRKINDLLQNIDGGTLSDGVKNKIKGQAYFLRAFVYFKLVRLYGGIPLILHTQAYSDADLYAKRNKTSECITQIVSDLDNSISGLQNYKQWTGSDYGRITRGAAMAFKGRVLLYWASPQFMGDTTAINKDRWVAAYNANKAALDTLTKDGYKLLSNYRQVFLTEGTTNTEAIFSTNYAYVSSSSSNANTWDYSARPYSAGGSGTGNLPIVAMANAFPMKDGKAINASSYTFDPVLFWQNRDPRFYATIAYNGCIWPLNATSGRYQWSFNLNIPETSSNSSNTGFYCRKAIDTTLTYTQANGKQCGTDWIEIRYAEVMLNLAECANELYGLGLGGTYSDEAYTQLAAIRARAKIEKGSGNFGYGLTDNMTVNQLRSAIMLERQIEFAFENKRFWDLRRRRMFSKINGTKRMYFVPTLVSTTTATAFNTAITNKTIVLTDANYKTYFPAASNSIISNTLDKNPTQIFNLLDSYYFFAIPTTDIKKNPYLEQTNTWGGSFDPLQ